MKSEKVMFYGGVIFFIIGLFLLEETKLGWYHPLMMDGMILTSLGIILNEVRKR